MVRAANRGETQLKAYFGFLKLKYFCILFQFFSAKLLTEFKIMLTELRTSLEEHQSALELIMSKYREQMFRLLMASKKDDPSIIMKLKEQHSKVITSLGFYLLLF